MVEITLNVEVDGWVVGIIVNTNIRSRVYVKQTPLRKPNVVGYLQTILHTHSTMIEKTDN